MIQDIKSCTAIQIYIPDIQTKSFSDEADGRSIKARKMASTSNVFKNRELLVQWLLYRVPKITAVSLLCESITLLKIIYLKNIF